MGVAAPVATPIAPLTGVPPNLRAVRLSGCRRSVSVVAGGFSPTGFRRSWRVLLPGGYAGGCGCAGFSPTGFRRSSRGLLPVPGDGGGGWVQPHWVPAVIAGAPSWGVRGRERVGSAPLGASGHRGDSFLFLGMAVAGGFSPTGFRRSSRVLLPGGYAGGSGWVQPHWVPAVIASPSFLTPNTGMAAGGIENSNPMVTERYITRITVSRQALSGQVADGSAAAQNGSRLVTISHERPRSS